MAQCSTTWPSVLTTLPELQLDLALRNKGMTVQSHVASGRHVVWGGNPSGEMLEWFPVPPERKAKIESQIKSGINRVYREIQREVEQNADTDDDDDDDDDGDSGSGSGVSSNGAE